MPILGFNPSVPSNTQGALPYVSNLIPADAGMEGAPTLSGIGADAVAATVTGAFLSQKLDGTTRLFAGTGTKLYELGGTTWTDRSVSGGSYTAGSEWSFCQFGDYTIASNRSDAMQVSTATAFANLTGPKAKIVESVVTGGGGFVFAFNTDATQDTWICSGVNDHTVWTPSIATSCTTGRLLGYNGPIVAAKRFGASSIVAYKQGSMFMGNYVGGDSVWQWQEFPEVGCVGPRAVCDIGYAHVIVGLNGFWVFDGARPLRFGNEVRQWFLDNVDYAEIDTVEAQYDQASNRVWIFFRASGASGLSKALVYHIGTQQWGVALQNVETTLHYIAGGTTYANDTGTYAAATGSFGDAPISKKVLSAFGTDHKLGTLTGTPGTSAFQTHDIGDVKKATRLTEAFAVYALRPTTARVQAYAASQLGGVEFTGPNSTAYDEPGSTNTPGRFTLRQHARWHRLSFEFTGPVRVTDYGASTIPAGVR